VRPGGWLVFNVFLPQVGYTPDTAARELGLQVYTSIFTYPEVAAAVAGLGGMRWRQRSSATRGRFETH
jgi:hypothetical protein